MKQGPIGVFALWAACAGFLAGIFARSLFPLGSDVVFLCGVLVFGIYAAGFMRVRSAVVIAAFFFFCGGGIIRMESAVLKSDPILDQHIGRKVILEGFVIDEPDARNTQVRVPMQVTAVGSSTVHTKILVVFPAHTDVSYGERVVVSGQLHLPQGFDAGGGRVFNYPGLLAVQGIQYELDRAFLESPGEFAGNPLVALSYRIKELFVAGLQQALPEPEAGLAGGITAGDKRALGKDLTEEFRRVSLVHIIVLSGYNITIVISALFSVLRLAPRSVRFGSGAIVALFFAVMTGFASASLRAALMALISITGSLTGRIYRADRALILVAAGMVAWNPYLLVFDPGFQLSFLATAGLIVFSPFCEKWFERFPDLFSLREIATSTTSAQIAVLPLLLYESGTLSLVALPANLLVLAAIPPAMLASLVAAIGGLIAGPAAPLIGFPAYALLSYVIFISHVLANIPFAAVQTPPFSAWFLLPVYAALFGVAIYFQKSDVKKSGPAQAGPQKT